MKHFDLDKRKFERHAIRASIHIKQTQTSRHALTYSIDLSEGGLCFYCDQQVPSDISIEILIPVGKTIFTIRGRVAYSRVDEQSKMYRTGVEFESAEQAFHAKLAEEIIEIQEYKKGIEKDQNRAVSENEAALEWIQKNAAHFESDLHRS